MRAVNLEGKIDGRRLWRDGEKRMRAENWEDKVDGGDISEEGGKEGGGRWNERARE